MEHSADFPIPSSHARFSITESHAEELLFELAAMYGHVYEVIPLSGGYYICPRNQQEG